MTNSRAGVNKLVLLDNHLATGTEATYTYTPGSALNMKTAYRELYIIITGKATAALQMSLKLNAQTDYNDDWLMGDTGTVSTGLNDAISEHDLVPVTIIDGAVTFSCEAKIRCNDAADLLTCDSIGAASHEGNFINSTEAQTTATTVTSIEILTSTSTWIAGTEISIYGIKR